MKRKRSFSWSMWINRVFVITNTILFVLFIYSICARPIIPFEDGWKYQDFVTILLACCAVILAGVTIFVALIAIWGYNAIREAAEKASREVASDIAKDIAQVVAAREFQNALALSGGFPGAPDINNDVAELTAELRSGKEDKTDGK